MVNRRNGSTAKHGERERIGGEQGENRSMGGKRDGRGRGVQGKTGSPMRLWNIWPYTLAPAAFSSKPFMWVLHRSSQPEMLGCSDMSTPMAWNRVLFSAKPQEGPFYKNLKQK